MAKLGKLFPEPTKAQFRTDSVDRVDFIGAIVNAPEDSNWFQEYAAQRKSSNYTKLLKTDEGYLIGRAVATSIGVFPYLQEDGSIQYELRAPEHVYDPKSLDTLKMVPLTNNHPSATVTADNRNQYSVGNVGENIDADQMNGVVSVPLSIQQKDAVDEVESGKRGLSCGYSTDLVMQAGNWNGIKYDAIQTNIKYNHLAIVDVGRAGDAAVMKMDGAMQLHVPPEQNTNNNNKQTGDGMDVEVRLDHITFKVNPRVKEHLDAAIARADDVKTKLDLAETALATQKTDNSALQAKFDAAEAEVASLKEKLDNSIPSDKLDAHIAGIKKMDKAIKLSGVEVKEDASTLEKKKAVVSKFDKDLDVDSKDEAYINVAFDIACSKLDKLAESDAANTQKLTVDSVVVKNDTKELTPEQKLDQRVSTAWISNKGEA